MVNDVSRLTRSIRRSVAQERAKSSLQKLGDAKKRELFAKLNQSGRAEYSDNLGSRFQIQRKIA